MLDRMPTSQYKKGVSYVLIRLYLVLSSKFAVLKLFGLTRFRISEGLLYLQLALGVVFNWCVTCGNGFKVPKPFRNR